MEKLVAKDPANADWQFQLFIAHNDIGAGLNNQGDPAAALAVARLI